MVEELLLFLRLPIDEQKERESAQLPREDSPHQSLTRSSSTASDTAGASSDEATTDLDDEEGDREEDELSPEESDGSANESDVRAESAREQNEQLASRRGRCFRSRANVSANDRQHVEKARVLVAQALRKVVRDTRMGTPRQADLMAMSGSVELGMAPDGVKPILPYNLAETIICNAFDVFQWEWDKLNNPAEDASDVDGGKSDHNHNLGEPLPLAEIVLDLYNDLFRKWELFENDMSWSGDHMRHRSVAQVIEDHQRQLEADAFHRRQSGAGRRSSSGSGRTSQFSQSRSHPRMLGNTKKQPSHIRLRSLLQTNTSSGELDSLPSSRRITPLTGALESRNS